MPRKASECWCPKALSSNNNVVAANRIYDSGEPDLDCMCLGSKCGVWKSVSSGTPPNQIGRCGLADGDPMEDS